MYSDSRIKKSVNDMKSVIVYNFCLSCCIFPSSLLSISNCFTELLLQLCLYFVIGKSSKCIHYLMDLNSMQHEGEIL